LREGASPRPRRDPPGQGLFGAGSSSSGPGPSGSGPSPSSSGAGPSGSGPSPSSSGAGRRQEIGSQGESLAAHWYEHHGYEVLERNWRRREGEVDLIVRKGRTVVFCEVKVRSSDRFGTGAEAVVVAKQRRIRRLAARWLTELTPASGRDRVDLRFDVVSITAGRVEVIENAF
jgi:putative endonuclease